MIEVMITMGIIAIIAVVAFLNLSGKRNIALLTNTTQEISSLLRQAQGDSLSQKGGLQWGVHFDNTTSTAEFYALFSTPNGTYASATIAGQYPLPAGLCFATSSVPAASTTDVIFNTISGAASVSTTITLQLMANSGCSSNGGGGTSGGVTRNSSGKIFFDDFARTNL